ncbi:cation transporter [bacterium]|nr:cation transporter [bacterium]
MFPSERNSETKNKPKISQPSESCKKCAIRIQHFSLLGNIFLALFKGIAGIITGSLGLIADATHSSADVLNSFVVLLAVNISVIPPDQNHPYGHGKVENICGLFVGVILFFGAYVIIDSSVDQLIMGVSPQIPHPIGLLVSIISIIANEVVYSLEICAAKAVNSPAIEADALENRMDAIATAAVFLGLLGAQFGYPWLDATAALFVGIITGPIAWSLVSKNIAGLMDSGSPPDQVDLIEKLVLSDPDVKGAGYIKTRYAGRHLLIDLEILVRRNTSISKSDEISERIKESLKSNIEHVGAITIVCKGEKVSD